MSYGVAPDAKQAALPPRPVLGSRGTLVPGV